VHPKGTASYAVNYFWLAPGVGHIVNLGLDWDRTTNTFPISFGEVMNTCGSCVACRSLPM
jgi:hypothetical protein